MHHPSPKALTQDDINALNSLLKAIKTRMELIEKMLNENTREQPNAVPGAFGD